MARAGGSIRPGLDFRWVLGPVADDEHRCGAAGQDVSGNAAEEEPSESGATTGPEHDEICASLLRYGDDLARGIASPHLGINLASSVLESRRRVRRDPLVLLLRARRSAVYASRTCPYIVGATPVVQGRTTSATLTTRIGTPSKIGHRARSDSAA